MKRKIKAIKMYPIVSKIKTSKDRKVLLSMNKPACVKSVTPISEITPVVKKTKMNWLHKDGYMVLRLWGNMILENIFHFRRPKADAASI